MAPEAGPQQGACGIPCFGSVYYQRGTVAEWEAWMLVPGQLSPGTHCLYCHAIGGLAQPYTILASSLLAVA